MGRDTVELVKRAKYQPSAMRGAVFVIQKSHGLARTKWTCKYHIVFYRRKIIYNQYKESIRDI